MALPFAEYFVSGPKFLAYLGALNVFVIVGVPALMLAFLIARLTFNKRMSPHWKAGLWSFFVINMICFFAIASSQARHFNRGNEITKVMDLTSVNSDTLVIDMQDNPYADAMLAIGDLQLAEDKLVSYDVHLRVIKSDGENFEMKQVNKSRGLNAPDANRIANKINYDYNINGNKISFPRIFTIEKETKWRGQSVVVTLSVPVGKTIRFEKNANNMISRIDIDRDVERPWLDSDQYWVMEDNGLVNKDWSKKNKMSQELNFKDFSNLQLEGKMKVQVKKGDQFKISITGKEDYLKRIEAVQLGKTLSLVTDINEPSPPIRVEITMPSLHSLDMRNTDDVKVQGFTETKMRLKNDGSYDLKAFVNVDSLTLVQDGRGEINVRGSGKHLKADLIRRAKIDTERFTVNTAEVKAQEFSKASIAVSESVKIDSDNSSSVKVEGEGQQRY
jgi:hypothetical protein